MQVPAIYCCFCSYGGRETDVAISGFSVAKFCIFPNLGVNSAFNIFHFRLAIEISLTRNSTGSHRKTPDTELCQDGKTCH